MGSSARLFFENDRLALSEMSLCASLKHGIGNLLNDQGFEVKRGVVICPTGENEVEHFSHLFWMNDSSFNKSLIVCVVPGQFIDPFRLPKPKGQKLEYLRQKSPTLVRKINDEVTILRGFRSEIEDTLNLAYITEEEIDQDPQLLFL